MHVFTSILIKIKQDNERILEKLIELNQIIDDKRTKQIAICE
jgi:hypothetical protein